MSSDETPKIEPILTNAPSIAPEAKPEAAEIAAPKTESEGTEARSARRGKDRSQGRAGEDRTEKIEPKLEAPTLPPAAQIAEPGKAIVAFRRPETKTEKPAPAQSRSTRFALLAACVAIAASFGAIGGGSASPSSVRCCSSNSSSSSSKQSRPPRSTWRARSRR